MGQVTPLVERSLLLQLVNGIVVEAGKEEQVLTATLALEWLRKKRNGENQPLYFVTTVADMHWALDELDSYVFHLMYACPPLKKLDRNREGVKRTSFDPPEASHREVSLLC